MLRFASLQPTKGSFTGLFHIRIGRRILHTLIKRHGNVRTQVPLNLYTLLRPHKNTAPINVGGKGDPFLLNLPPPGQRKDLEPSTVCENRTVPTHKAVKPPHLLHQFIPWAQMEVIRIGELNLTANFPQILSRHRAFNCPLRSHVHKHGRLRGAMGTGQLPASGAAFGFQQRKQRRILLVLQNEHGLLEKMSGARALPLHRIYLFIIANFFLKVNMKIKHQHAF